MTTLSKRIKEFNKDRLQDMVQLKYKFMTDNMFRFYRGTCHLFYEDLAEAKDLPASPQTWISGDLHLENFGSYKGDNRLVYFDLNDFDEAVLAPANWELVRIVTSIFIAFQSLEIDGKQAMNMARLFLKEYSATLARGRAYYIEPRTAKGIVRAFLKAISKRKQKHILKKKVEQIKDKMLLMMDDPKHFEIEKHYKRELYHHITEWIMYNHDGPYNYEVADAVFRVAGTGSIGLKRYVFLLRSVRTGKHLLVEMKQATPSSLAPYLKVKQPEWETEAERIIAVQQRMQNISPALLSATIFKDEAYIIQEMQPVKDSINFKLIKDRYRDIYQVISDMAVLTASSHIRSSGRQGSATADDLIAFGMDDSWQEEILNYAVDYEKRVEKDFKAFVKDYDKGVFEN